MGWGIPGISVVKDVFDIVSTGAQIYSSYKTIERADEVYKLQKKELNRSRNIEAARAKREARVRSAQLLAAQGRSGAVTSTSASGVYSIESSLSAGLTDLEGQVNSQAQQYRLAASQTKQQAVVNTFTALGTFAATDTAKKIGKEFTSFMDGEG